MTDNATNDASWFGGPLNGDLDFDRFVELCADPLGSAATPAAAQVESGVPIYDGDRLRSDARDPETFAERCGELADVLGNGSGVLLIRNAWSDQSVVDAMTDALLAIVERERTSGDNFDHFAAAGANSRAWDVLGKAARLDPAAHVDYYANPVLDLVSQAWLGPWYQLTAQVNIVHPGGAAQSPHRDYHLGFLSNDNAMRFPAHAHRLSQALTLQGGIAHTAMPLEAGPTQVLPGSQRFVSGYLAWRDPRFQEHFANHSVQLAMDPGDALFFNPGLHHGAGENRTSDHDRIGNLVQISSPFGVPMEAVDWPGITIATYPTLRERSRTGTLTSLDIAICASGYPFPSNLDTDRSDHGLAPASMQELLKGALASDMEPSDFAALVTAKQQARQGFS